MTQMLASANSAWVCWLCWLCWCSGSYTVNTSEFLYYLDELHSNELVFAFSFVSSNNTHLETTEQFILLHARYVCDFSGLTNFSQKLWSSKKTSFTSSVFLLLTHDEFFDAFQGKTFRLETVCLFQKLVIEQFIRKKIVSLTACLLVGFWESRELLHLRGVLNYFLCFWSELATVK